VSTIPTDERSRPRVEGDREDQILAAALQLMCDVGYDRLTMDAVATAAHASKATLYRRWTTKADLVVDAVSRAKACPEPSRCDTGSLRGDLLTMATGAGGLTDEVPMGVMAGLVTALHREPDLARAFQERFIGPRSALSREVFVRARARGEVRDDADLDLLTELLPAVVIHHVFVLGRATTRDFIERVVDDVVLRAARS
jgi:AcrR family transcriptional regulator